MESREAAVAFGALGQETRIELLLALLNAGPPGMPASDIAAQLNVPTSTLSFHLKALEHAGLITATRQGRNLIYAARLARLHELMAFVSDAFVSEAQTSPCARPLRFNVLFLCTRNSARSIMAEAIVTKFGSDRFNAFSAGSEPAPEGPLPEVLAQLKALGHDVSGLRSKSWDAFTGSGAPSMDFVIALCDTLNGQACPDFGATIVTAAWPLPDPAKFTGKPAERASLLNELYAGLRRRLDVFANLPLATLDRMALRARVEELADPHALARR